MTDYKYAGLTTYLNMKDDFTEKLTVLSEAIEALQRFESRCEFEEDVYQNVIGSAEYQFLYNNDSICYPDESELPNNMPENYKRPFAQVVNVKGVPLIKLYVPAVAKDGVKLHRFINNALPTVISNLFGNDVVSMMSKECTEYDSFEDGSVRFLVHAKSADKTPQLLDMREPIAL